MKKIWYLLSSLHIAKIKTQILEKFFCLASFHRIQHNTDNLRLAYNTHDNLSYHLPYFFMNLIQIFDLYYFFFVQVHNLCT